MLLSVLQSALKYLCTPDTMPCIIHAHGQKKCTHIHVADIHMHAYQCGMACAVARRRRCAAVFEQRSVDKTPVAPFEADDEAPRTPPPSLPIDNADVADDNTSVVPYEDDFETDDADDFKMAYALVLQVVLQISCPPCQIFRLTASSARSPCPAVFHACTNTHTHTTHTHTHAHTHTVHIREPSGVN